MADSVMSLPKFDGLNFQMIVFLQSLGSRVVKVVTKPFNVPDGDEDTWPNVAIEEFDANARAHYALL